MKQIEVEVRASLAGDGSVQFDSQWRHGNEQQWRPSPIELPKDSGEHDIQFTLDDRTGRNLRFYDNASDAIWVNVGSCPRSANGSDQGQIHGKGVDQGNRKKLKMKDRNSGPACDLHYALRFDGDPWSDPQSNTHCPPYEYDPVIKNGGTGT